MCKKQTAVSHSSTESEIISLDTGLRLNCLPALELWDLIVSVLGNVSRVSDRSGQPDNDVHKRHKSQKKIDVMENIDSIPSNVRPHHGDALLDGNAHSVKYGEMIHDGSGQPDSAKYQEEADSENFVMGSDAAEICGQN